MAESITEMIESRTYLLGFQKEQLLEDFRAVPSDDERIEKIIDTIFYKLFGKGWDALTEVERRDILYAWRGIEEWRQ